MFSPIGNAIGQLIPVIIVTKSLTNSAGTDDDGNITICGMSTLMAVEFALCVMPLLLAVFYFQDKPPTAPSNSTLRKEAKLAHPNPLHLPSPFSDQLNNNSADIGKGHLDGDNVAFVPHSYSISEDFADQTHKDNDGEFGKVIKNLKEEVSSLLANKNYIVLFIAFAIGVGFFNSLLTLLNQIVAPHGYSNDDAGTFGAVFIGFGLVGAGEPC